VRAVPAFDATAAVFDVDDSLVDGNVGTLFTAYLFQQRKLAADVRRRLPGLLVDYARGKVGEPDMVKFAAGSFTGIRVDELRELARRCFLRHVKHRITADGLKAIRRHLLDGHFVMLASGSPQVIVDELARELHVHAAVGSRAKLSGGVMSDVVVPPINFREGKRDRVLRELEARGIDAARSFLYSDSPADTPLFERVGHPVVVSPKAAFRVEAKRRGWTVVDWTERYRQTRGARDDEHDFPGDEWRSWGG